MQACFSLMLGLKHSLSLKFDAAYVTNSDLVWITVNRIKQQNN